MSSFETYTLRNELGMEAVLINPGLILQSLKIPVEDSVREVTLGFSNPLSYFSPDYINNYPYLGAVIGRIANRIKNAHFHWNKRSIHLYPNNGPHCLHGGNEGFDKRWWKLISKDNTTACFLLHSPDGDENFPGELQIQADIWLTDMLELGIKFTIFSNEVSPVNLTWHPYFNLDAEKDTIKGHRLQINSDRWLETNDNHIVTGIIKPNNWGFDILNTLSEVLPSSGIDHGFILSQNNQSSLTEAIALCSSDHKLKLTVFTNNPIVHVYTGQHLPILELKNERKLFPYNGICFECQLFTDFVNQPHFPQLYVYPDKPLVQETVYSFNIFEC
jgi:aldose 1-epimerase